MNNVGVYIVQHWLVDCHWCSYCVSTAERFPSRLSCLWCIGNYCTLHVITLINYSLYSLVLMVIFVACRWYKMIRSRQGIWPRHSTFRCRVLWPLMALSVALSATCTVPFQCHTHVPVLCVHQAVWTGTCQVQWHREARNVTAAESNGSLHCWVYDYCHQWAVCLGNWRSALAPVTLRTVGVSYCLCKI